MFREVRLNIVFSQSRSKVLEPSEENLSPVFTKKLTVPVVKPAGNVAELKCPAKGPNITTTWLKVTSQTLLSNSCAPPRGTSPPPGSR